MNRYSTIFLQAVTVLISIGTLAFLLWEPHIEGRNAQSTLFEIYFHDPFLAYAYTASIAFFVALYQTFRALGYVRQHKIFTPATVDALRTIKWCAVVMIGFVVPAVAYLFIVRPGDDIAGGVFLGVLVTFASTVAATAAAMFQRIVQDAVDMKFGNDATF